MLNVSSLAPMPGVTTTFLCLRLLEPWTGDCPRAFAIKKKRIATKNIVRKTPNSYYLFSAKIGY